MHSPAPFTAAAIATKVAKPSRPGAECTPPGLADPEGACKRLLRVALQLFAEQGYAKTSIRQIAAAAQVNVAAVSYYFGDKSGLYQAVFRASPDPARGAEGLRIASLDELYQRFLEPLRQGDAVRLWVKLYRREMLEPTGLWQEKIECDMRPMHAAVVTLLCEKLALAKADDDVHRLAVTLVGLAVHLFICCDVIDAIAPQLATTGQVDAWQERLVQYAEALIQAERLRRAVAAQPTGKKEKTK
jgi:AcrR family transcriptional regulator